MGWLTTTYLSPLSPGGSFSAIKDMVWLWDCSRALAKMQRGAKAELGAGGGCRQVPLQWVWLETEQGCGCCLGPPLIALSLGSATAGTSEVRLEPPPKADTWEEAELGCWFRAKFQRVRGGSAHGHWEESL